MDQIEIKEIKVINATHFSLFILVYLLGGLALTAFIAKLSGHEFILWIGGVIFALCPILFKKQYRSYFTKLISIRISKKSIVVEHCNKATGEVEQETEYKYDEIESYQMIKSGYDYSSFIKLYFKDGSKIGYTFLEQRNSDNSGIIYKISEYIREYNASSADNNNILLKPNLLASPSGGYIMALIGVGWLALLIFIIIFKHKAIPIAVISGLFFQLWTQRKRDIERYMEEK